MNNSSISLKGIATFFLVLMCVQYIPIEGYKASDVKIIALLFTPFFWLSFTPKISKAVIWGAIYLFTITISILYNSESFRITTILYKFFFVFMFIMYYNFIFKEKIFSPKHFLSVIKGLLYAYIIVLLVQQVAILSGIRSLPIINLTHFLDRGLGANSLAIEPSHAARIMTVLMLIFFRMSEVVWGKENMLLSKLFRNNKWLFIGFLWAMISMGSGTAFVGLGILSLYFMQRQFVFVLLSGSIIFYFLIPSINYEPLNRARASFEAVQTFDQEVIKKTDYSAASRIVPLINTLTEIELTEQDTWFGKGIDTNATADYLSEEQKVGGISDYGLISYIVSISFVFTCCIRKILSLEALIFILLLGAGINNIAYVWGILMLFATSNYFLKNAEQFNNCDLRLQ
ncbi:hypothetical protein [Salinimicrobium sp. TH3]|uniref:hypothetical protein n=1 Tax=Salinimicrobium sp. TH3 TaxID=2997342 RepID=UPI002276952A|nr:hypothetical protein [Salinimicrobium sp. TH3]MCY2687798.1 hypothetical protein [Salinimicrobium sp. TH3]